MPSARKSAHANTPLLLCQREEPTHRKEEPFIQKTIKGTQIKPLNQCTCTMKRLLSILFLLATGHVVSNIGKRFIAVFCFDGAKVRLKCIFSKYLFIYPTTQPLGQVSFSPRPAEEETPRTKSVPPRTNNKRTKGQKDSPVRLTFSIHVAVPSDCDVVPRDCDVVPRDYSAVL